MRCIHCRYPFLPLHLELKHKQKLKTDKLLWLSSSEPTGLVLYGQNTTSLVPLSTNAITNSIVLGVTSPAQSGNVSGLLQYGALLFFVYWIANFVVPNIISKSSQIDEVNDDQKPNDNDSNGS